MHGFAVFLNKEFKEILRTWRIWVLPLIMVFIGLTSPIIAQLTPDLVESLTSGEPGVVIQIPDPTTKDAYLQFMKNAAQMALLAVIIASAGLVAAERRNGTAALVLTKPVSRRAVIVAKVLSNWALLAISTIVGAALCIGVTSAVFDFTLVGEFLRAVAVWYVLAAFFVALMIALSVATNSQAGAAGIGLAVYLVLSILSQWGPARDNTLAGLITAPDRLIASADPSLTLPIATGILCVIVAVAVAVWVFERQEL